jgi:hypothetical protein
MRELRVGAAYRTPPATLVIEDRGYNSGVSSMEFNVDAQKVHEALKHLPSGTFCRLLELLLNEEIREYQELGDLDVSEKFMAVREVYTARREESERFGHQD